MSEAPDRSAGGSSRALQGCLFGAVALFVVMLLGMLYLGYIQFQNNTEPGQIRTDPAETAPVTMLMSDADV